MRYVLSLLVSIAMVATLLAPPACAGDTPIRTAAQITAADSDGKTPAQAVGLFGPSRRELLTRMEARQDKMYIEMVRQTEILRQIAGQNQQLATQQQQAMSDLRQHLIPRDIRSVPELPATIPANIRGVPELPPTVPQNIRVVPPQPATLPQNIREIPEEPSGPILQGTSGRQFFTRAQRGAPVTPASRRF